MPTGPIHIGFDFLGRQTPDEAEKADSIEQFFQEALDRLNPTD
jgi:hypothetical protein